MTEHRLVVSIRELEQVKLLVYELQQLQHRLAERNQPEADDLSRILRRFTDVNLAEDRS
jgi:hypothetical protein